MRVYMTSPIHGGGSNVIAHGADSPDEAHAIKDDIVTVVHSYITR